jgi:hypothetical protein
LSLRFYAIQIRVLYPLARSKSAGTPNAATLGSVSKGI